MNNEENLYGISQEEFKQITEITEEQMKKHPEKAERILMEFCHMALRNKLINVSDVLLLFLKKLNMNDREVYAKYRIDENAMYFRNQKEDRFMKIVKAMK